MNNSELILILNNLPQDAEVCIWDWRKNIFNADDDGNGIGIEPKFTVEYLNENVSTPFIAISFENDDYNDNGEPSEVSLLSDYYSKRGNFFDKFSKL